MGRTHAQAHTAIDNVLAQTKGQRDGALLGFLVANGVIVDAACQALDDGIESGAILLTDNLLEDDSHLLLVDDVGGGSHVVLRTAVEDRGIDCLDGIGQKFHTTLLVLDVRNHVGAIDARKVLVMRVFEQRRGTDGDRSFI